MTTSVFFNNFMSSQEQQLIENLIIESIRIYGIEVFYLPRSLINEDKIYGESSIQRFDQAIPVEMYIKNVEGFEGDGDFLSKFGVEIRDRMTLTVARRSFMEEVATQASPDLIRPNEGDLIYFPLNKKVFQIRFVEHESVFYQMGSLQTWDLVVELFEYSNEVFDTKIADIDNIYAKYSESYDVAGLIVSTGVLLTTEDGFPLLQEFFAFDTQSPTSDNTNLQTEADSILDFSEKDPFSESGIF